MTSRKKFFNVTTLFSLIFIAIISAGSYFIWFTWKTNMDDTSEKAMDIAITAEATLRRNPIKRLTVTSDDLEKTDYISIKENLMNLVKVHEDMRFAYLFKLIDDKIYFMVDSEPEDSEDYSPPGQEYTDATEVDFKPFRDGNVSITPPETDSWGTWVTVFVPVKDSDTGEIIAVFGIDYPLQMWYDQAVINTVQSSIIVLSFLTLLIVLYVLVKKNAKMKEAQSEIRENEEKFRLLITKMTQGVSVHDIILDKDGKPCDYRYIDVNEAFEQMTGKKRDNIIGKTILEVQPDIKFHWIEDYGKVALTGEPYKYLNHNEYDKYLEVYVYSPQKGQFAALLTDVTDRKKLEIALSKEKILLETTLASIADGVISTDSEGKIVFINRNAEYLTGWKHTEAKGKPIDEVYNIVNEYTRKKRENIVKEIIENGKNFIIAESSILISKNGAEQPIEQLAAPIVKEDGEVIGTVLVFRETKK